MRDNFMKCLEMLLEHEGGFTADPRDEGNKGDGHGNQGSTNLGVTSHVWAEWTGQPAPMEVMKTLTPEIIGPLYKKKYWDAVRGDDLVSGLDWACFDWCVNSGSRQPAQALQRIVSAKPDGKIGPKTLQKIADNDSAMLVEKLHDSRQKFYESLRTFPTFGRGWTRCNKETMEQAISMSAV